MVCVNAPYHEQRANGQGSRDAHPNQEPNWEEEDTECDWDEQHPVKGQNVPAPTGLDVAVSGVQDLAKHALPPSRPRTVLCVLDDAY